MLGNFRPVASTIAQIAEINRAINPLKMKNISKTNNVRLKQLLRKLCQIALDELTEALLEKRVWTRPWILKRNERGSSALVLEELRNEDAKEYISILRMMPDVFDILLSLVMPKIQRQHTIMREALPAKVKLEITVDFLSSGISYRRLSHFYRVSRCSISKFIPEVCEEIFKALKENIKVSTNNNFIFLFIKKVHIR